MGPDCEGRANERIEAARTLTTAASPDSPRTELPATKRSPAEPGDDLLTRAVQEGRQAPYLTRQILEDVGFSDIREKVTIRGLGIALSFVASDQTGSDWAFDVSGGFTNSRSGLCQIDTLWKELGKAAVLHQLDASERLPLVLITTDAPVRNSSGDKALRAVLGPDKPVFDVVEILDEDGHERLRTYATNGLSQT